MYFPSLRQASSTICRISYAISLICTLYLIGAAHGQDASSRSQEHYRLGMRHAQKGDYESAEREYRKAIELDANNIYPHDGLGFIYALQSRLGEAEEEFAKVLQIDPATHRRTTSWVKFFYSPRVRRGFRFLPQGH